MSDKNLKDFVTNKKQKKENPSFTKMRTDKLSDIEKYLNNKIKENGSSKKTNGAFGTTLFTSHKTVKEVKLEDFKTLKVIGRGSFGKVCLVEYLPTHEIFAMKGLKKDVLIEQEQISNTLLEKEILQTIDYPLLCKYCKAKAI